MKQVQALIQKLIPAEATITRAKGDLYVQIPLLFQDGYLSFTIHKGVSVDSIAMTAPKTLSLTKDQQEEHTQLLQGVQALSRALQNGVRTP